MRYIYSNLMVLIISVFLVCYFVSAISSSTRLEKVRAFSQQQYQLLVQNGLADFQTKPAKNLRNAAID